MPISTSGSSGTATGTFTNSNAAASGVGSGTISVFTTPNTANAIFIVNYQLVASTAAVSNLASATITMPGILGFAANSSPGAAAAVQINNSSDSAAASGSVKVGPNTALSLAVVCKNGASASAATFGYRVNYDYVSIVVS